MEQSATSTERPTGQRRTYGLLGLALILLTLALALSASASAFVANGGGGRFESPSGPVASAGACASDSSAQTLLALLAVQQAQLIAWDAAAYDSFGFSVALSGETALVGAPYHTTGGKAYAGAAYVFTRSGGSWTAEAQLIAADGAAGDWFGYSVALSGETALVGARYHTTGGKAYAGAAYVFTRSGGSWTAEAQLIAADGADRDYFGYSVALSGETALVGAPYHTVAGKTDAGAAYVFTRSGGSWTAEAQLTAADGAVLDSFGDSVALSGETALVGALGHDTAGQAVAGAAYVFTRTAGSWMQQAQLTAGDGAHGDFFGTSVALSGETALVGAPAHATGGQAYAGAAYVFTRSAGAWTQQAQLTAGDGAVGDQFGDSVALSGETALVGAPYHDTAGQAAAGAAYVFVTGPTVTSFLPAAGPVGTPVTLTGTGFSGATAVTFNGAAAAFSEVSDAQIRCRVPAAATSGPIAVIAPGGTGTSAASFTVIAAPTITKLKPASGRRGAFVTISGTDFGAAQSTGSVQFGSKACTKYVSWSDTQIKCRVPTKAKLGKVKVTVNTAVGNSNAMSFTIKR